MKQQQDYILLSASDLMRFVGCRHATTLDLAYLKGAGPDPRVDTEDAELLQKQGNAHEANYLDQLKASGKTVIEVDRKSLAAVAQATRDHLAAGPDIIFQGAFLSGQWGGWSDFLERVDRPSLLGEFSYEVTDTKLKRRPDPKHVLQLVLYSDMLAEVQGTMPEEAHLALGDGSRVSLRVADYAQNARAARQRLEDFVASPEPTRPIPCSDCALCRWADHCESTWTEEDSLFNVANITRGQVKKLEAAGIRTLAELSELTTPVRGMAEATLDKLTVQAQLQQARKSGYPDYRLRPFEQGKGFDLLPEPQPGDLFYDIEGDPHYEDGLEYLHGLWFDDQFKAFWAHDHDAEAQALADLLAFFRKRLDQFPGARIYHYAPYEITALRRLTIKYGIGEAFLDRLLREHRFVDLFAVVRGGLIASEPNYSIKSMEAFYGIDRTGEVTTAGGSVVAYERWRETGEQSILDEIEEYNLVDCVSTEKLRDWLIGIRPDRPWPSLDVDAGEKEEEEDAAVTALRDKVAASDLSADRQDMLFNLGLFHNREAKPAQWAVFDSAGKDEDELIDDLDALAGLAASGPGVPVKRSVARSYTFPPQETKLRAGKRATVPDIEGPPVSVSVEEMEPEGTITLKVGEKRARVLADRLTLHPDWPLNTGVIADALADVIDDQCGPRAYRAVDDLLASRAPRMKDGRTKILLADDPVAGTIEAVHQMDDTLLAIQGPPGTGKTYVSARAILSLVKAGYRVGVTSNSHEAIRNVLTGCVEAMKEAPLPRNVSLIHKVSSDEDGYDEDSLVHRTKSNKEAEGGGDIVGGTAFFFSRSENLQAFDWLFVDEAGQVGLANMAAMGRAARNIVLVGDPQQLPQVIQGAHPSPANLSCLQWMLGDHATVPEDRGIFLPTTRRMHPDVCKFISQQVYEDRLQSHPDTATQRVSATPYPESGAFLVPVEHEGNAQVANEEVAALCTAAAALMAGTFTDKNGVTRAVRAEDIIVVAPYNAQVNALRAALPDAIRVGTVDKFQGQEAPICLVSMTASSAEETPRGMEFLFSLNRINVAVSRAKALSLVFASPRLCEAKCTTVEQMKLVNTLCALKEV
ncbi:TM0106 family RecB-like putative nuclease [Henriciella sp.]|uniref:TM0106 family RecB-like putative nuclease n=1 Tax=Henriciella sp. TaxID=1968823 RepID=UPI0026229F37|nr:TM0106 family RecB-like putative nuclease [Henriciella sp.]